MVEVILIILLSLIVLITSILLFRCSSASMSLVSLDMTTVVFYKDFLILSFFGTVLVFCSIDVVFENVKFFGISGVVSEDSRFYGWVAVMYALIAFPLGVILSNLVYFNDPSSRKYIRQFKEKKVISLLGDARKEIKFFILTFLLAAFGGLYIFYAIGDFPLRVAFSGASKELLAQIRSNAKIHFSGIKAIKDVVGINLSVLTSYLFYAYTFVDRSFLSKALFGASTILVFLVTTYNLEKIPFFFYLFGLVLIRMIIRRDVSLYRILLFVIIVLLGLLGAYYLVSGGSNILTILKSMLMRIFLAETSSVFLSFEYFPNSVDFLGVKGISNSLASIFAEDRVMYGRKIFELYNPDAVDRNVAGYIVGLFVAESWALFGWYGVLLIPLYVGFIFQSVHNILIRLPKNPIVLALYAFFSIRWGLTGGVSHVLFPSVLVATTILFLIFPLLLKLKLKRSE